MADECTLYGLPTPTAAVTATDVQGSFCCRSCLEVARAVADLDDVDQFVVDTRVVGDEHGVVRPATDGVLGIR
ncbi:hypothetical protein ACFR99_03535 [Haloarchaeobius amylolyticus]|uniref:Metal-binding protein n=1 Tax=Haloarchaeobius amylolyticus TaxID=1198296 RepID=A0ABD6BC38_9EURY